MKKTLKAILGLVLALTMVLSFAACSKDEAASVDPAAKEEKADEKKETGEKKEKDASEEAVAAVEELMDGVVDYDQKVIEDELGIKWFDIKEEISKELGSDDSEEAEIIMDMAEAVMDAYIGCMKYEIGDVEEDDGVYTVAVEFTCADGKKIGSMLTEEGDAVVEEIAMDLLESGKLTEDMSEEEMTNALMKEVVKAFEDKIKSAETNTMDLEFVVEEDGDEWVVNVDESDYDELKTALESMNNMNN